MAKLTGRVFIALNGQRIRSKEGASLDMGGVKRDAAMSDAGVDGFTETIVPPRVECKINHGAGVSLSELQAFADGRLIFETDSGRPYVINGAWCAQPPKLTKGEVDLVFEGVECIEG